jgi:hypothetical protein
MEMQEITLQYEGEQGLFERKQGFIVGEPEVFKFQVMARDESHAIVKIKRWMLDKSISGLVATMRQAGVINIL